MFIHLNFGLIEGKDDAVAYSFTGIKRANKVLDDISDTATNRMLVLLCRVLVINSKDLIRQSRQ